MSNTSGVLRIITAFICVVLFLCYGFYRILLTPQSSKTGDIIYNNYFSPLPNKEEPLNTTTLSTPSTEPQAEAVQTVASGEVLGKVYNKTITKSSANLSYKNIYIKNDTDLDINISKLLSANLGYTIKKDGNAQVLIVHTHATECFLNEDKDYYTSADNSRTTDNSSNVTALGAIISEKLNSAGIVTLHDKTQHDYPSYNESYSRAAKTIRSYLKKYPEIKVVIDIHRDSVQSGSNKTKLTADIAGRRAAQVMLVMGSQSGNVKNFPDWQENLKLALRLQNNLESMYPTLARPLSLMSRSYNEPLTTGSMLIEIGTDANAFSEAVYSAELLANSLIETLGS